jgi:serine/threonine protein kinase
LLCALLQHINKWISVTSHVLRQAKTRETAQNMRSLGTKAYYLKCAGFDSAVLLAAGYTASELKATFITASQLQVAGCSAQQLMDSGFSTAEVRDAFGLDISAVMSLGCTNAADLKAAGFSLLDLKSAGFTAVDLKSAGCIDPELLLKTGYSAAELRSAEFAASQLQVAGCSAQQLMDSGFSTAEVRDAFGLDISAVLSLGCTNAADLKAAGFSLLDLKSAGFTAAQLKGVFSVDFAAITSQFQIIDPDKLKENPFASGCVASGSFGEVRQFSWQGVDVALKELYNSVNNFEQECRMMHQIQHPNCVQMFGVQISPRQAIVMEWMGGGNLQQYILQRPIGPLHRRLSLFRQICAGLNYLHSSHPKPIIHSDLKPANIMLDTQKKVAKITDFGLSKVKASSYASSRAGGTLQYQAPEILMHGSSANQKTDVYAMGIMLWEILAGKMVWFNEEGFALTPGQLVAKHTKLERPDLSDIDDSVDPDVVALMRACWAQDPSHRPTAEELWRRMSLLDVNNSEFNQPLIAYKDSWLAQSCSFEECLQKAVPPSTFQRLLLEIPRIETKYWEAPVQQIVQSCKLSEVEAKCIIVYTLVWPPDVCPRNEQLYGLFTKAYRERDEAALERCADFSFFFWNGLNKLPGHAWDLFRGLDKRLTEICDLYEKGNIVHWHQPNSATTEIEVASPFSNGGTLLRLVGVTNAKSIQAFSLAPEENEFMLMYTSAFVVESAVNSEEARLLGGFGRLPPNVDLVVLRAN